MRIRSVQGIRLKKELSYKHLLDVVQRQQEVINSLCQALGEGQRLFKELTRPSDSLLVKPTLPPIIHPGRIGHHV